MTRGVEVKEGQSFQDRTGLAVRVERIDANHRIHFSVIDYREGTSAGPGEMSDFAYVNRFTRINKRSDRKAPRTSKRQQTQSGTSMRSLMCRRVSGFEAIALELKR